MPDTNGQWMAVYSRYGSIETDVFDFETDALDFLHEQEELTELSIISLHGPDKKWTAGDIRRHFQEIYERDHADEIAEQKRKAEEDRRRYEEWLAAQPAWKRDRVSSVEVSVENGYTNIVLNGFELPFVAGVGDVEYTSGSGSRLTLEIPLDPGCTVTHRDRDRSQVVRQVRGTGDDAQ